MCEKIENLYTLNILAFICTYIALLAFMFYTTNSFSAININFPDFILIFLFFPKIKQFLSNLIKYPKDNMLEIIYGISFSLLTFFGKYVYEFEDIRYSLYSLSTAITIIFGGAVLWILTFYLIKKIFIWYKRKSKNIIINEIKNTNFLIILLGIILLLVYFNCFLAFYPGLFTYDSMTQFFQIVGEYELSNHHSVIHTLFLFICLKIGAFFNFEGLALYSIIQILFISSICMFAINKMIKGKTPRWIWISSYLYFLLVPTFHIFSFEMTKDIFFSGFFILFLLYLNEIQKNQNKKNFFLFIFYGILCCLFRTNMIALLVPLCILILFHNKLRKLFTPIFMLICLFFIYTNIILPLFNIKNIKINESLSVPLIQLSKIYAETELDINDKLYLEHMIPNIMHNCPYNADLLKSVIYLNTPHILSKIYFKYAIKYPSYYITSFLSLNIRYLYIFQKYPKANIDYFDYIDTDTKVIENYHHNLLNVERKSKNIYFLKLYKNIATFNASWMRLPIFYQYFLLSFVFTYLLVASFVIFKFRLKNLELNIIVLILFYLTYLMGATNIYRYLYPFYLYFPILFSYLFQKQKDGVKDNLCFVI